MLGALWVVVAAISGWCASEAAFGTGDHYRSTCLFIAVLAGVAAKASPTSA